LAILAIIISPDTTPDGLLTVIEAVALVDVVAEPRSAICAHELCEHKKSVKNKITEKHVRIEVVMERKI
jgi:hypothetical protein